MCACARARESDVSFLSRFFVVVVACILLVLFCLSCLLFPVVYLTLLILG